MADARTSRKRAGPPPPAAAAAAAASGASAVIGCGLMMAWALLPEGPASLAVPAAMLLMMPVLVAVTTWLVAQHAIRASMDLAVEAVESLAGTDLSAQTTFPAIAETAGLAVAIERTRLALHEQRRGVKVHAAVARVMGLAIGRIAEHDFDARISVDLPAPYASFRDEFNGAMEALRTPGQESAVRLRDAAHEIAEAADRLGRRAAKLAARIGQDLAAAEADLAGTGDAVRTACHTLGGAGVAATRNIEAAERFSELARLVAAEAGRLAGETVDPAEPAEDARPAVLRLAGTA